MYAQFLLFKTAPGKRAEAEKLADQAFAVLKNAKGFKTVMYFGDLDSNEYCSLYVWETKEDLEAVSKEFMPKMQEATNALAIEPPFRRIYEVYEPKI